MDANDQKGGRALPLGVWGIVGVERDRRSVVLANWKMHKTSSQGVDYVKALKEGCQSLVNAVEIILCVPFTGVAAVSAEAGGSGISVGAQDVHEQEWGAYTGEVSATMLADAGCGYCLVGHSERRTYFFETDEMVNRKAKALLRVGIVPIVCIGETLDERRNGLTLDKLEEQVVTCLEDFTPEEIVRTVLLYEPIWAIGTGNVARPEEAEEAHRFMRKVAERIFSREASDAIRIVYGGSVRWSNVSAILRGKNIDGVAMGSESLNVQNFIKVARVCTRGLNCREDFEPPSQ